MTNLKKSIDWIILYGVDLNLKGLSALRFQRKGAPPLNTNAVCDHLHEQFLNHWFGNK